MPVVAKWIRAQVEMHLDQYETIPCNEIAFFSIWLLLNENALHTNR